ncbi:uncharacterized protein [Temnothorax nylanderi]|uniref:uncharacterized protein n=1 Tax=Temnothorax nylanderi TaxID=102681 RepID=UPI003A8C2BFC
MDVEEGEAKMCRLCGQYEKIYIDVFEEEGVRRYLGTKIHKINILIDEKDPLPKAICVQCLGKLEFVCDFQEECRRTQQVLRDQYNLPPLTESIHKDDALPQQICASCVDKLDFVCDFYDSCHVIQERLWWLIESLKNQRQEIQKQPADYQTNEGDDPTQEGVTLGTEYSTEYSNIIIKEECLPDLNLDMYPSNQETQEQPASYQTNKGDDPMQEGVTLGTEYSTEYSNIIIKEECLPDLNLELYPSNQGTQKQPAGYQTNKGDDPTQEKVTLGTEYSTEYSNIINKKECLPDLNLDMYPSNQETQEQPASYQTNKGDDPMQEGVTLGTEYSTEYSNIIIKEECLPDLNLELYPSNQETQKQPASYQTNKGDNPMQGHLESKFKCPKCPNVYKSKHNLNEHLLKHEGIKKSHLESKFKCPKCPNVYKHKHNLNEHLLKHEGIKKNVPCDTCGKIFHSHVRLRVHMQRHKSNSVACEICRYHLSSKEALEKHNKTVHLHDYVCDICHKKLKSKRKLRTHIISHLESKFKCPKCPNVYKSKHNLNEHLLKHEGIKKSHLESKFKCPKCPNVYKHKRNLNEHLLKHDDIKKSHLESKFKCPKCPNVYKRKENLNEHLLKHEDIKKNFPCDTCGKIFYSHLKMRVHMHRHKNFACEICRRHLSNKEALEKHHKTVHLHDYVCDICHKKLKSKQKLRGHIISHLESKFKCPKCPNVYKSKSSLNEHMLKHEGIRKYECSICKKTYCQRSHLTRHQKVHSEPRLCGQYEKIYIDVFGEEGFRRYLGTKIHKKINILADRDPLPKAICVQCLGKLEFVCDFQEECRRTQQVLRDQYNLPPLTESIHKDDALPQQICASCVDKLDFVCDFYDSCHVIQERLWWLIESSKNQRQEIQKQPADYQTNEGDDPTQEGVTLGTEYSTEYSNIIIKEECLPDLNLELYPSNQGTQKQPAGYQTNKGDDPTQEEVTLGTEYSTEYSNIINKKECLPDLNLDMYPSNQETREQPASYQTNKGDDPMQEGVTLGTEYSTEYSNIIIKEECLPNLNLELYPSNQETQKQPASYQTNKGDNPMQSHLESKFKCPNCPNVYKHKYNLNKHLLKHEDIKKNIPCDTCGKIFHSHVRMRVHMRRHKSNSVTCEICRRHLSSKEALKRHHKTVHLHDYVCDICHKKLKFKQKLRAHMISHLESKFKCPKCPNVYKSKQNLNEHLLKHEDIKKSHLESKFKCPKCPNVYKNKHNLNDHLLSKHEGIRKYECSICKKRFGHRSQLARHQKVHPMPRNIGLTTNGEGLSGAMNPSNCLRQWKMEYDIFNVLLAIDLINVTKLRL